MSAPIVTTRQARLLLLGGQALLDDPRRTPSLANLRRLIDQLGFVQIDSINTVARAHHLVLRSRLAGYRPAQLDTLLEKERFLFEHWTHDASAIPTSLYPQWWPRFRRAEKRILANAWWRGRLGRNHRTVLGAIRRHLARHGEVRSEDFDGERSNEEPGWWSWTPHKAALELMWRRGELAVARRVHFQKVYALAEQIFPAARSLPEPTAAEHLDWACRTALDRLGVATVRELVSYWASVTLADARAWVAAQAGRGALVPVRVESEGAAAAQDAWAWPDWKERWRALPEPGAQLRLLCPFDPILRDRARAERRFAFDYRFEAFTPAAKRQYGYYVLAMLEGERLVGRIDPKLDRERSALVVNRIFWERRFAGSRARTTRLMTAIDELARWLGAERVELPRA